MRKTIKGKKLSGYNRPISCMRFNADSDILFGASKDKTILSWYTETGSPLADYIGHSGSIYDISIKLDSTKFISASSDCSIKQWDTEIGTVINTLEYKNPVRISQISASQDKFFAINFSSFNKFNVMICSLKDFEIIQEVEFDGEAVCAIWGLFDEEIIVGLSCGKLLIYQIKSQQALHIDGHNSEITDIQMSLDCLNFISCSTDQKVIMWNSKTYDSIDFNIGMRLNTVSLSPFKNYFACGGGTQSAAVTTTKINVLDIFFYDIKRGVIVGELFRPHAGPVNSLRIRNDGLGATSGGEDGTINLFNFEENLF